MTPPDVIPTSEIQSELNRLWETLEGENKHRASLFNLIFYTPKRERAEYIHTIAAKVIEKFPSRIIFITADDQAGGDFLNARASVIPAGEEIACDLIEIDCGKEASNRLPFVILPQLLPDLPIYVIWGEDPCKDNPLFHQLKKMASRLIFDSETTEDLASFTSALQQVRDSEHCDIADLNWARMESWRNLLSSTFYPQDALEKLQKAKKLHILYNNLESPFYCHTKTQALYLQGWLASQLGWERKEAKNDTLIYNRSGVEVKVILHPEKAENLAPGAIISVDLQTEDDCHFSFGRNLDMPHVVSMRFSTLSECKIPLKYLFEKAETGRSLVREIGHKGTSTHFMNLIHNMQGLCGF